MVVNGKLEVGQGAGRGVMACVAEYLTARAFAASGDHVVWSGGGGGMYDLATHPEYTDVKKLTPMAASEKARRPGCGWKMRRPAGGAFATEKRTARGTVERTHLALVRIDLPAFEPSLGDAEVTFAVAFERARISYVPTDVVNEWMAAVGEAWLFLVDAALDAHLFATFDRHGLRLGA